jgi:ABC-2 type transport system ATP-binding protein
MININNLTVKYGSHIVLDNLNLDIEQDKVHGIVGLNGSGKTTLLNTIFGLVKKINGSILYNGEAIKKNKISILGTDNFFYSSISGIEYLNFFLYYNKTFNLEPLLDLFNLPLHNLIDDYSTGMKKKLAILASLILDKEIMIFDEPFNGIDIESIFVLTQIINKLKHRKKIIIITSHIINTLTPICDRIHHLHEGKIKNSYHETGFNQLITLLEENLQEKYKNINDLIF